MNDPIISPWLIYLIGVAGGIKWTLVTMSSLVGLGAAIWAFAWWAADPSDDDILFSKRLIQRFVVPSALVFAVSVLMPTRDTIIAMVVADNVTPASLQKAGGVAADVREIVKADVLEIIEAINDGEGEE